jgi:mannose-6-phosphate isomerase-like protein (cupin superfamily)
MPALRLLATGPSLPPHSDIPVWHTHEDTDELFLVLAASSPSACVATTSSSFPGEMYVVPRGVEHCPVATDEVQAVLIELTGVVNTGDAGGPLTAGYDDSLG